MPDSPNAALIAISGVIPVVCEEAILPAQFDRLYFSDLVVRSASTDILDIAMASEIGDLRGMISGALVGPDDQLLRVLSRTIDFDPTHRYDALIAGDAGEVA